MRWRDENGVPTIATSPSRLRRRFPEAVPVVALTLSEGAARLLSLVFYLVVARLLDPTGFGVVRYTITLATLAFFGLQVLSKVLSRELGAARSDAQRTNAMVGTALVLVLILLLGSSALCVLAAALGLTGSANTLGMVVVLAGLAAFQVYYAIGRGLGHIARPALTYIGGSVAQLGAFVLIAVVAHPGPVVALLVFGLSSFVPIVAYELVDPVIRGVRWRLERDAVRRLWVLAGPLVVGQALFVIWSSADQVWVDTALGTRQVGLYGAAKTLSQLFVVLPEGFIGALLPRIAELRSAGLADQARRLIGVALACLLGLSAAIAAGVIILRGPLLSLLYGDAFRPADASLAVLAFAMVLYGGYMLVIDTAVGWGRPLVFTGTIALAAVVELAVLLGIGGSAPSAAAWAYAASVGAAFALAGGWMLLRPHRVGPDGPPANGSPGL